MRNFVYFVLAVGACLSFCASGECVVDGSVVGDAYSKLWNADVQRRIDERIERHRKADGDFEVSAPDGTEVTVQQISHAFQFGSHIFNFDQLGRDDWNDEYKAVFTNLWNAATVPFYWREMEPKRRRCAEDCGGGAVPCQRHVVGSRRSDRDAEET